MADKLKALEDKINQILERMEQIRKQNQELQDDNISLKADLVKARRALEALQLLENDRSEIIRTKLTSVLGRIDELESIGR